MAAKRLYGVWGSAPEMTSNALKTQGVFVSKSATPMANYLTVYVCTIAPSPYIVYTGDLKRFIQDIDISDLEIV